MDNFDLRKYLIENKITTQSRLNENELGVPSEGMHKVIVSYIRPEFKDKYAKDYKKYWTLLNVQAKPLGGSTKPQVWMNFLNDLIRNRVVSKDALILFSEKYNHGGPGLQGLATYLFKQGAPDIIEKIDNLRGPAPENSPVQGTGDYTVYEPSTFRKPSGYKEEVEQIKNLIKRTYPEYVNTDISLERDADMELASIAYKVYGINISVDDIYKLINNEDPSELPKNLKQTQKAIEDLTGEPMIALKQAMKELNIQA
jgi:hypothetical protein